MDIKTYNKNVISIYYLGLPIVSIYTRGLKIWPKEPTTPIIDVILSCFYNGYWIDEYPWTDDTPWTD